MRLSEIVSSINATHHGEDVPFQTASIDTRTLSPGALFVAMAGEHVDGHDYIAQAQQQGAAAALVSKIVATELPTLQVKDTRLALGQIAALYRQRFTIPFLAHTGSNGKTTTKEMIAAILRQRGQVLATQGNLNNDLGVPLTLMNLTTNHQFAVIELGANHPGEIAYTGHMVKPHVAMITNIAPAHTEGFGNIDGVAKAKAEIYQSLDEDGIAIINKDELYAAKWLELNNKRTCHTYAIHHEADYRAHHITLDKLGHAKFELRSPQGQTTIDLPLPGKHNVSNALAAAAATAAIGATLDNIKQGLINLKPIRGRLHVLTSPLGARIIDDTYNANPASVTAAIEFLCQFPTTILVLGDMGELGEQAKHYHQQLGTLAKQKGITHLYTCGTLSRFASEAFGKSGQHFSHKEALLSQLIPLLTQEVSCLIKGSRSAKMENIVKKCLEKNI